MGARGGALAGEIPERTSTDNVVARTLERLGGAAARVRVVNEAPAPFACPVEGLVQVLLNLLQNALDASAADEDVELLVRSSPSGVSFVVADRGVGVPQDELARAGEPFYTTKALGERMGLGVFLANTFARRWGAELRFVSEVGKGTRVALEMPCEVRMVDG